MADGYTRSVLLEVYHERCRQDSKWGQQNWPMGTSESNTLRSGFAQLKCQHNATLGTVTWRDILDEEVQEAFAEDDPDLLRAELVQVAAVAVAMVECIDRRKS
jgi:hypothetical protein